MLSSGTNNLSRATASVSSDLPTLTEYLHLEPIPFSHSKYTRSVEVRRVLGILGSASEDSVATEELKHLKESVQDSSKEAGDLVKAMHDKIFKLDKFIEASSSKKRQRSELSLNERSNGANLAKMGNQLHRNSHDIVTQRLEDRAKSVGLNKRVRTSVADLRADGRSNLAPRQQVVMEKVANASHDNGGGTIRFGEKIRRLPAGGEGWDTKNKKKRSVGLVGTRNINGDRELKRAMHPKIGTESKLRTCDTQSFRSKCSPGVGGINKVDGSLESTGSDNSTVFMNEMDTRTLQRDRLTPFEQKAVIKGSSKPNINEDSLASSPNTVLKAKFSRAPRTGSIMMLDSSLKAQSSSTPIQGAEHSTSSHKVSVAGMLNNHKRQTSAVSSSMAQWVGQRPKNSRKRRANIVAPVSKNSEAHISTQDFPANDFSARTSIGANGSPVANGIDSDTPKFKRETDMGLSESEESGAGNAKTKERGIDSGKDTLTSSHKAGSFLLPSRKNKFPTNEIGDGVQRQGRSGRGPSLTRPGIHAGREKLENLSTRGVKAVPEKNKSKTGRPPSKRWKDRKPSARIGPIVNGGSIDYTGESDDDREDLFAAANSARNASYRASCGLFWKEMESIFASISSEDLSFLKQQLTFAEEIDESLSQMLGDECNLLSDLVHEEPPDHCNEGQGYTSNQDPVMNCGKIDVGRLEKGAPLYQRVLSALIEEDECEEVYFHGEGKNFPLHYASDDSHCGSCNLIDIEPKDRDRIESEVESTVDFQTNRSSLSDRCDKSVASNTIRNSCMSNSLYSNERWPGDDDFPHLDIGQSNEICSNHQSQQQTRDSTVSGFPSSDHKYQLMCLNDRVLLELQSIGLCPETLPDLTEGEEVISQDIMELKEGLYQQIGKKKRKLGGIEKAVQKGQEMEKRNIVQVAMDQLIELAHRKRLACRRNNSSKIAVRKVSRQVALAFIRRTLARYRKFEDTGNSCFSEPALQEVIFSTPACDNEAKDADCVGSGTASNTCIEVSNHHAEARGSVEIDDSNGDYPDRRRKREVLIDDVIGSASSRVTSSLSNGMPGGTKAKRSDRDRDLNKDILRNSVSGTSRSPLERKTKSKPKQKSNHFSVSGTRGSCQSEANPSSKLDRLGSTPLGGIPGDDASKEADEAIDFGNLQLHELNNIGLEVANELGGPQDLGSWLSFDDDGLQDHDSIGLAIPMDDLTDLQMLM